MACMCVLCLCACAPLAVSRCCLHARSAGGLSGDAREAVRQQIAAMMPNQPITEEVSEQAEHNARVTVAPLSICYDSRHEHVIHICRAVSDTAEAGSRCEHSIVRVL